jgi:hypothetical protein
MDNLIKVNRPIFCSVREFKLEKGVTLRVNLICEPMVHFLYESYLKDGASLLGDLGSLRRRKIQLDLGSKKKVNKYELGELPKLT